VRWAALVTIAAGVVAALSAAQLAPGQAIERVRIDRPGAALPAGLFLIVGSPDEYSRAALRPTSGTWAGPEYWRLAEPAVRGRATIDWELGYDDRPLATERIALANLTRDWFEDQRGGISVDHVVGRRVVGTLPGFYVLQVERRSSPSELVMAFPVAPKLHVFVRFLLLHPETDDFYVKGSILASSWNRGQALLAMSRVRLVGNLPPSLVSIRVRRRGVVAGSVVDFFRHAVAGASATLERRAGSRWKKMKTVRTTAVGGYNFSAKRGSYRVRATLAGRFSATSRPLRVPR
jgi:hypothetical protein